MKENKKRLMRVISVLLTAAALLSSGLAGCVKKPSDDVSFSDISSQEEYTPQIVLTLENDFFEYCKFYCSFKSGFVDWGDGVFEPCETGYAPAYDDERVNYYCGGRCKGSTIRIASDETIVGFAIESNGVTSIDLSGCPKLEYLGLSANRLEELDVTDNPELRVLRCDVNMLKSLDLNHNFLLERLECSSNELGSLDVSRNPNLEVLYCYQIGITELNVTWNPRLKKLWCDKNKLTELDLSGNQSLELLMCSHNSLTGLDVSEQYRLNKLLCDNNLIAELKLGENESLIELNCSRNRLTSLDLRGLTGLEVLDYSGNFELKEPDISKCVNLYNLNGQILN